MLSSLQLEAFLETAKTLNISKAAKLLHLTQSALSQRILNLEAELETTLMIRHSSGLRLTEAGENLLRYCHLTRGAEKELLDSLRRKSGNLSGMLRVGGFSTITRSILLPLLNAFRLRYPHVQTELFTRELYELPDCLIQNQADFIFSDREIARQDIESCLIGNEVCVLVEAKAKKEIPDVFLDHDKTDTTTLKFWKLQKKNPAAFKRVYLDEIYSIVDAVKFGWGRAVVPVHLIKNDPDIRVVSNLKPLLSPVYFHYWKQPYYTRLHKTTIEFIRNEKAPTEVEALRLLRKN